MKDAATGQVIMTTHSEVPIVELTVAEVRVVASEAGATVVRKVGGELQAPSGQLPRRCSVGG